MFLYLLCTHANTSHMSLRAQYTLRNNVAVEFHMQKRHKQLDIIHRMNLD